MELYYLHPGAAQRFSDRGIVVGKKIFKPPVMSTMVCDTYRHFPVPSDTYRNVLLTGRLYLDVWQSLLQFDISSLPPLLTLVNSTLHLYPVCNEFPSAGKTIEVFQIVSRWRPKKVCRKNKPLIHSVPAATAKITGKAAAAISLDLTELVNEWYLGCSANFGVLLSLSDHCRSNLIGFASGGYPNSQLWPQLEINFLEPACCSERSVLDISLDLTAIDTPRYTRQINVLLFNYTYQIANNGTNSVQVYLEVSPDGSAWQRQTEIAIAVPGQLVTLVPNTIAKFSRLCYQSIGTGQSVFTVYIQGVA